MKMDYGKLSKIASHALRHEPWLYELELDDEGWVSVAAFLTALRLEFPNGPAVTEADLAAMIAASDKQRHELKNGRIRALYGHSLPGKLLKQPGTPPALLYHGTAPETAQQILATGLQPMGRQYVHLSADQATARQVGGRKSHTPVLLHIDAQQASSAGVAFYRGNDNVWLTDVVPARFITLPTP